MRDKHFLKRLLSVALVLCILSAWIFPAGAIERGPVFKQVSNDRVSADLINRDPVKLNGNQPTYAPTDVVRVSIFLDQVGVIDAGFSTEGLVENDSAMAYRDQLKQEQTSVIQQIEKATQGELDVVWNLTLAANLISANVPFGQIEAIEKIPGVRCVAIEVEYEPQTVDKSADGIHTGSTGSQIGVANSYAAGYTGAGMRIAVIDTGVDTEHLSFDSEAYAYSLEVRADQLGLDFDDYLERLDLLDAEEIASVMDELNIATIRGLSADELYINPKLPFGFNYVDEDYNVSHMFDSSTDHGSHVSGIACANAYIPNGDGTYSKAMEKVFAQGVAPDAQLIVMKVFGVNGGAYQSDYVAAMEDAIVLGADSINLSLGSSNPGFVTATTAEYQAIFENLSKSGVVVSISAGNAGSWMAESENGVPYLYLDDVSMQTGGSPATYGNALGVASVDNAGYLSRYLTINGTRVPYIEMLEDSSTGTVFGNKEMITLLGQHEYVFLNGTGTPEQLAALGSALVRGKIIVCFRGDISFAEKANAAAKAGAAGLIVVNNQPGRIALNLTGYSYTMPAVSLTQADGEVLKTNAVTDAEGKVLYWTGTLEVADGYAPFLYGNEYDSMSTFSGWGVTGSLTMKPEITAPGGYIYSVGGAYLGGTEDHVSYVTYSGTSMAAPQVAGMAALVAQYIQENNLVAKTGLSARTLAQSLLMSTAVPVRDGNNEGYYYPVLQQGAGLANVGAAIAADSYILMNADATAYYADGKVKVELGDDPDRVGQYVFSFTINNLTDSEKVYALSADFFTQAAFAEGDMMYLDTMTWALEPMVEFTVDGSSLEGDESMAGMDFNGDGVVDSKDGQALVNLAVGTIESIHNAENADLDGNGSITTRDAYLFLQQLGGSGVKVGANGTATVSVTVTLSGSDKELLEYYENGAYLQGYVYAESVEGTSHSIPVLGFYGNWSDASMFDKGSYEDYYLSGEETRAPYLYETNFMNGQMNGLFTIYGNDPANEYYFGGNPIVLDEVYMPERNAINAERGDMISSIGYTAIRNAGTAVVWVADANGNRIMSDEIGAIPCAYYNVNSSVWKNTYWGETLDLIPDFVENNTRIEVGLTLVPEYYLDAKGNFDWNALGNGVTMSMTMVVDNTAPVLNDVAVNQAENTMTVRITENQYVAAVVLVDPTGEHVYLKEGSQAQAQPGVATEYVLDVSGVNGTGFLLQVYDYAMNCTTYEIDYQIGEMTDEVEEVVMSQDKLQVQVDRTAQLTATVLPVNTVNRDIIWMSWDESIATVDENGVVTGVSVGTTEIWAFSDADDSFYAVCEVEVIDISTNLNGIVWDENGDIWFAGFDTADLPNYTKLNTDNLINEYLVAATMLPDGRLIASSRDYNTGKGSLYVVDPITYELTKLADCKVGTTHIFYSDLTYAPHIFETGALLATYGPYVIALDPDTGVAMGALDSFYDENDNMEYLVGIAYEKGSLEKIGNKWVYEDFVYIIKSDGTVVHESYYGYDGKITPYSYFNNGYRIYKQTGISVGDSFYYNSAYCDGEYLYWAAFDTDVDESVSLYAIETGNSKVWYKLGDFGKDVWPVCGLYQDAESANSMNMEKKLELLQLEESALNSIEVQAIDFETPISSVEMPAMPMNNTQVGQGEESITVDITAKDVAGNGLASNNGMFTVTYDSTKMTLQNVVVNTNYSAYVDENGVVTIGYVSVSGFRADDVIASLTFDVISVEDSTVTVTYLEINDTMPGNQVELDVEFTHGNTEVRGQKEATCTEEGYTGDIYCADCGKLLEKGQTTPVKDHNYENGSCTECGATDPDYNVQTVLLGDLNMDGKVNSADVNLLYRYVYGDETLKAFTAEQMAAADANQDGNVNSADVSVLYRYAYGDTTLTWEPREIEI